MNQTQPVKIDTAGQVEDSSSPRLTLLVFAGILTIGLTFILSFNIVTQQQVALEVGERAGENIEAPRSITYVSDVLTRKLRDQVAAEIYEYTPLDRAIGREQTSRARAVFSFIEVVRADPLADFETKLEYVEAIIAVDLPPETRETLLNLPQAEYNTAKSETLSIIAQIMQQDIRAEGVRAAQESVRRRISFDLNTDQEQLVAAMAPNFIVPNVFFDEAATQQARGEAIGAVEPVQQVYSEGQLILRVGEIVEDRHLEALEKLGLLRQGFDWFRLGTAAFAALLTSVVLATYWWRFTPRTNRPRMYLIIWGTLILLFALIARFMLLVNLPYLFPAAALAMLITVVSDARLAIVTTIIMAALFGFMNDFSLELAIYLSMGGLFAGMTLRDTQRFYAFFRSGLFGALGYMAVVLLFRLGPAPDLPEIGLLMASGAANAIILSPILTISGFFLVGLFGVTTVVQLQDLSRLDHPLLQELLRRAPGTYHHSIMVANLAEQAAERTGANSTLVRVGAFYHDIGKMNRPPFFTENQEGSNPHDSLDPYTSARIIVSHVSDGLEMARENKLPQRIQDFIAEHHGSRTISIFYERARQAAGSNADEVDVARFRYPGPRPASRETGIVMLADTIEAASSAMRPSSGKEIERLVNALIDDHLKDGQLDDSDLTMGDLKIIRASFIETLKGRYHVRVRYPGNEQLVDQNPVEQELEAEQPVRS